MVPLSQTVKKITIYYFSGTGNTQIISHRLLERFKEGGFDAAVKKMEAEEAIVVDKNEMIGIGFPIASFTTYPVVFEFLKKLPVVTNIPAFGFCTMGGASLWGIIDEVRSIITRKGYRPMGFSEFKMPPNIFFGLPEGMRKNRVKKGYNRADMFAQNLIDGKTEWNKKLVGSKLIFLIASGVFKLAEIKLHQKVLKIRVDRNKCNRCGLCVQKCPVQNITLTDNIVIGNKCQYCFRCVAVCPMKATFGILSPKSLHYRAENSAL
jgi:NAD-dependent dihydropyrimidine dehydrogenase PreA subunit/flavodoxin